MFKNVNKSQVYFFILAHLYFYGSSFAPENGKQYDITVNGLLVSQY